MRNTYGPLSNFEALCLVSRASDVLGVAMSIQRAIATIEQTF